MSTVQCPVCALRFRFQSELDTHAHEEHCPPPRVTLPPQHEPRHPWTPKPARLPKG